MNQTITYQNYRINFRKEGSGELLVFLHGWPTNSRLWQAQVERLKTDFTTITPDWLGFGQSDKPTDHHYTFTKKKEILDALLSNQMSDNDKVTLVAHDIGGPPAILWASENEARIKRLILLNTVIYPFKTKLDRLSHVLFNIPVIKNIMVSQFSLGNIMKMNTRSGDKAIGKKIQAILADCQNIKPEIKLKTILEPLDEGGKNELLSLSEKFSKLNIKKYLIIAKGDPLCYEHIKKLSMENPSVPAFYIENCGHYIPIDQPYALNGILRKILKE